jgi:ABC-2 type transport system permease protein
LKKYLLFFTLGFQEALQYRLETVIWFLFDILPPLMMVFLWLAAYRETDQVAGYSLGAMLSYYLGLALLRNAITPHPEWEIAELVRTGRLSMSLLKPYQLWGEWLASDASYRVLRAMMVSPILVLAAALLGGQAEGPRPSAESALALAICLPLAYGLCFLLKICLGFTAFWLLEIGGLAGLYDVVIYLLGGTIVPLDLLPSPIRFVADSLPFKYIYYFPLTLALGRLTGPEILSGLALQAAWTAALVLLARVLWLRGLRRHEAVGA